jgi:hypothetical protein
MKYSIVLISFVSFTITNLNLLSQDVNNDTYMQHKKAAYKEIKNLDSHNRSLPDNDKYEIYAVNLYYSDKNDDILEKLKYFPELKGLTILQSKVTLSSYKTLKYLNNLTTLFLDGVPFTDAEMLYLKDMKSLEKLSVCDTSITDEGMKNIQDLKTIKSLGLNKNNITDEGLKYIQNLSGIVELSLSNTKITDKGLIYISGMKKLGTLDVSGTNVTVDGLLNIDGLDSLWNIDLVDTKFSRERASEQEKDVEKLTKHFPKLKMVKNVDPPKNMNRSGRSG